MRKRTDSKLTILVGAEKIRQSFVIIGPVSLSCIRAKGPLLPLVTCLVSHTVLLLLYLRGLLSAGKQGQVDSSCAAVHAAQHLPLGSGAGV